MSTLTDKVLEDHKYASLDRGCACGNWKLSDEASTGKTLETHRLEVVEYLARLEVITPMLDTLTVLINGEAEPQSETISEWEEEPELASTVWEYAPPTEPILPGAVVSVEFPDYTDQFVLAGKGIWVNSYGAQVQWVDLLHSGIIEVVSAGPGA